MKKYSIAGVMSMFVLIFLAASAAAQDEISYSYAEIGYVEISDGFAAGARVQYEVQPQVYIFGGYTRSEVEATAFGITASADADVGFLGGGYHMPIAQGIDLHGGYIDIFGELGYMMGTVTATVDGGFFAGTVDADVDGFVGAAGARAFVAPKLEVESSVSFAPEDFGGFSALARYHFHNTFSVAGGLIEGDFGVRLRASF